MHNYFNRVLNPGFLGHHAALDAESQAALRKFADEAIDFTESQEDDGSGYERLQADSPQIVRLLDLMIAEMDAIGAERIVMTPLQETVSVIFEVSGQLTERDRLPHRGFQALASRINAGPTVHPALERFDVDTSETEFGRSIALTRKGTL